LNPGLFDRAGFLAALETTTCSEAPGRRFGANATKHQRGIAMKKYLLSVSAWGLLMTTLPAGAEVRAIQPDQEQAQRWREFLRQAYLLHQRQIAGRPVRTEEKIGGYRDDPEFYREVHYYDARDGRLLASIQWERRHPERIHAIRVNVHDNRQRVIRDYSGWYLPHHHDTAPRGAWVNLHAYNSELHAYRQFDASNHRTYEYCRGTFQGKPVDISLSDIELIEEERKGRDGILASPAYRACFRGLGADGAGVYLTPQ
jgi:hypothetical protein